MADTARCLLLSRAARVEEVENCEACDEEDIKGKCKAGARNGGGNSTRETAPCWRTSLESGCRDISKL